MNFAAVGGSNILMFGVAPWKMETVKAMAILGTYKDTGEQRFTLRPEDMSRLVATPTGQFDPRFTPVGHPCSAGTVIGQQWRKHRAQAEGCYISSLGVYMRCDARSGNQPPSGTDTPL